MQTLIRTKRAPGLLTALTLTALAALGLAAGPAQAQDVIPPANATTYGLATSGGTIIPLNNAAVTLQIDYDASQLGAISPGSDITSLGFRLGPGVTTNATLDFASYDIELSQSLNPVGSLSSTFADNIGADATTVYDDPLTIAAGALVPGSGLTPGPFYSIAFTTPYTYNGGDLLITLRSSGNSSGSAPALDRNTLDSKADTVGGSTATATSGRAQFYSYPVISLGVQPAGTSTPEPASYAAFAVGGLGLLGLGLKARMRRQSA